MSRISTIRDALVSKISTLLPNHTQFANAYSPEANPSKFLKQGFGVGIAEGNNTNRIVGSVYTVERSFFFVLTRQLFGTDLAVSTKETLEKNLFEDQYLLLKDFHGDEKLGTTNIIARTNYVSDSGILLNITGDMKFLQLTSTMTIEYFESIL